MEPKDKVSISEGANEVQIPSVVDKINNKKFTIKSNDNTSFNLNIYQSKDQITFIAKRTDDIQGIIYRKTSQLKEFHSAKKYFKKYNNIDELFNDFFGQIKDNEITIVCKDNKISVGFPIETKTKKDEITFELEIQKKSSNNVVSNICKDFAISKNDSHAYKKGFEMIKEDQKRINDIVEQKLKEHFDTFERKIKEYNDKIKATLDSSNEQHKEELLKLKEMHKKDIDGLKKEIREITNKPQELPNKLKNDTDQLKKENQEMPKKFMKELDTLKKENEELSKKFHKEIDILIKEKQELSKKFSKEFDSVQKDKQEKSKRFTQYQNEIQAKINDIYTNQIQNNQKINNEIPRLINNIISKLYKEINKIKNDIYPLLLFDMKSNIIKEDELKLVEEGIKKKFNKKIKQYTLLYRGSRDGFGAQDFHNKCDGYNFTVTLVKTKDGNRRFGGFTDAVWDQSNTDKTGSNGFIFSLDNKEIYYNKNNSYNIYCHSGCGPAFGGGGDFLISDNCDKNNSSYDGSNYSYDTNGKKYALAGASNFYVENYEVYKIELE